MFALHINSVGLFPAQSATLGDFENRSVPLSFKQEGIRRRAKSISPTIGTLNRLGALTRGDRLERDTVFGRLQIERFLSDWQTVACQVQNPKERRIVEDSKALAIRVENRFTYTRNLFETREINKSIQRPYVRWLSRSHAACECLLSQ
jgi:hypothetical protein